MDPMRVAEDLQSRSPPAVFAGMLMLTVGLAIAIPVPVLVPGPWRAIGFVPVVAGVALHRAATSHLRRAGTPVAAWQRPATLVTHGVYSRTRNPMYVAGVLILSGAALSLGVAASLLPIPLYLAASTVWFIRPEESALEEQFGEVYRRYCGRVRRWA